MTETEQKRLYEHFKKLSKDGKDNIQRENCKKYATQILDSFPQFEVKEKPKENKETISKENKEKK